MKHVISLLVFLWIAPPCWTQDVNSRLSFGNPSIEQEASSIWRTVQDIAFFEKQGYTVNLPEDPLIDSLIAKSKAGTFGNDDFPLLYSLLESRVFDEKDYALALEKIDEQTRAIHAMILELESHKKTWNWDFKSFEKYQVNLTLYGSGGSYDPDRGIVTLYTTPQGGFKNYQNPAYTIMHEIVHMGVEQSIVQTYQLSHGLKERLVDTLVYLLLGDHLPAYKIQNMGDTKLGEFLKKKEDIADLPKILEKMKG